MKNLIKYENVSWDEGEYALIEKDTNKILLKGDYYHDKIYEKIEGFLEGLDYCGVEYKLEFLGLSSDDEMFKTIGFYSEED